MKALPQRLSRRIAKITGLALAGMLGVLTSQAATWYWNGNVSQDWSNTNNFQRSGDDAPGVPQTGDTVSLESWATQAPLINNSGHAAINDIYLSKDMGIAAGGALNTTFFKLGQNASATLTVSGGTLTAGNHLDVGGYNGGTATMDVTGGSITVAGLYLNLGGAGTGASYLNLYGGTITDTGTLSINGTHAAVINLAGGTLIVPASQLGNVNFWIGSGNIKGFGVAGVSAVNVDSVSIPGNLVLTGNPPPTIRYWNGNLSQDWSHAGNFQENGSNLPGVPQSGDNVYLEPWAVRTPLINVVGNSPSQVFASKDMTITTGGALNCQYAFKVGWNTNATVSLTGGVLTATNHLDVGGYNGGLATLSVSSGSVTAGGFYLNLAGDTNSSSGSMVSLNGGTLTDTGDFSINQTHPTLFNLAGGKLVVPVSQQGNVQFWMGDGSIAAHGIGGTTNSFHFDTTTVPGSLVITSKYPAVAQNTFLDWNPQTLTNLPPSLNQVMPQVPAGLTVATEAQFAFGTAVAGTGEVYFSEYVAGRIRKYNPVTGAVTTVVTNRGAVFGVAVDAAGNLFYAMDSDLGAGFVVKRTTGGSEQIIITNLTRPRQLSTDASGNLYVVLEAARQILKWDGGSSAVTTILNAGELPATPQGVAVAPDGRIYFSAYGRAAGAGTFLTQGTVWVRNTNGTISLLAGGFARARGVALHPDGSLYVVTEANVWDNGNSGVLARIATNGTVTQLLTGLDYAQFPSIGTNGILYVTAGRDSKLLSYDPAHTFAAQTISQPGVTLTAEGAAWQNAAGANLPFQLNLTNSSNPSESLNLTGYLQPASGAVQTKLWFNVPVTNFTISLAQLPNSGGNTNSGLFELPAASVSWNYGATTAQVIPLRVHQRCRWPMTNVGDIANETPAPDFSEQPESYLVYVSVVNPPSLKIRPWTGGQVRISWPTVATGYNLQRSATVSGGYASPGLTVTIEGSESVAYDSIGSGARFYRLVK